MTRRATRPQKVARKRPKRRVTASKSGSWASTAAEMTTGGQHATRSAPWDSGKGARGATKWGTSQKSAWTQHQRGRRSSRSTASRGSMSKTYRSRSTVVGAVGAASPRTGGPATGKAATEPRAGTRTSASDPGQEIRSTRTGKTGTRGAETGVVEGAESATEIGAGRRKASEGTEIETKRRSAEGVETGVRAETAAPRRSTGCSPCTGLKWHPGRRWSGNGRQPERCGGRARHSPTCTPSTQAGCICSGAWWGVCTRPRRP